MKKRRVVVTGSGLICPLGSSSGELMEKLHGNASSVVSQPDWNHPPYGLATTLSSPVAYFDLSEIPRKTRRTMSRVSGLAVKATDQAIRASGLSEDLVRSQSTGISYGSTMGGTSAIREYYAISRDQDSLASGVRSTTFPQIMSHTCAANLAIHFQIPGRVVASCTACAASTQSIGFGYESIVHGYADCMIVGGAEELEPAVVAVFDVLSATSSKFNDSPENASRPFSLDRDGIVVGEGAGTLILEEREQALARGAKILGEIRGYFTNNDACHMTNPSIQGLESVMSGALTNAGLKPDDICYINAHGTGTPAGDEAEARAISRLFGAQTPVSSLKGHFGHLMGACGVIESVACINMLNSGQIVGTKNIDPIDPACGPLKHVRSEDKKSLEGDYIIKNSFAFGGINACLIFGRGY